VVVFCSHTLLALVAAQCTDASHARPIIALVCANLSMETVDSLSCLDASKFEILVLPYDGAPGRWQVRFVPLLPSSVVWCSFWKVTYFLDALMEKLESYNVPQPELFISRQLQTWQSCTIWRYFQQFNIYRICI
jgi:hypothetical protein